MLSENGLIDEVVKPKNIGNRRIMKAYKCFLNCVNNFIEGSDNVIKELLVLASKINEAVLVFIEVDTNKDAYMLFESLNNRGISLSAIDLIKNYLISIADDPNDKKAAERAFIQ